jgi:hypothetical protein
VTGAILAPHETQRRVVSGKTGTYASATPGKSICVSLDLGGEMVTPVSLRTSSPGGFCCACAEQVTIIAAMKKSLFS